jgi:hypothetical protein
LIDLQNFQPMVAMRQDNEMRARTKHTEWAAGVAADFTNDGVVVDVELARFLKGNTRYVGNV